MIKLAIGPYEVFIEQQQFPAMYWQYRNAARLVDEINLDERDENLLCVIVSLENKVQLVVAQRYNPGDDAAFYPGLCLIPETDILFLGAGRNIRVYNLKTAQKIVEDEAEAGFWAWERHGDYVMMLAELGLAAWDISGKRLWTRFVEPPWDYRIENGIVRLNVMDTISTFPLATGDTR